MKKTAAAGERHRQPGRLSERLSKKTLMDTGIHTDPGTFSRTYAKGHGQKGPDGELERTTISIMQNLDELPNSAVVIAATNRPDIIDPALMRRFTQKYEVAAPAAQEAGKIVDLFFSSIGQENPYPESAAEEMYRESGGTPAALMAKVVQSLAEQIAAEESECAQEKS